MLRAAVLNKAFRIKYDKMKKGIQICHYPINITEN